MLTRLQGHKPLCNRVTCCSEHSRLSLWLLCKYRLSWFSGLRCSHTAHWSRRWDGKKISRNSSRLLMIDDFVHISSEALPKAAAEQQKTSKATQQHSLNDLLSFLMNVASVAVQAGLFLLLSDSFRHLPVCHPQAFYIQPWCSPHSPPEERKSHIGFNWSTFPILTFSRLYFGFSDLYNSWSLSRMRNHGRWEGAWKEEESEEFSFNLLISDSLFIWEAQMGVNVPFCDQKQWQLLNTDN